MEILENDGPQVITNFLKGPLQQTYDIQSPACANEVTGFKRSLNYKFNKLNSGLESRFSMTQTDIRKHKTPQYNKTDRGQSRGRKIYDLVPSTNDLIQMA